jgi:DNA helicase HerA-like ATPase
MIVPHSLTADGRILGIPLALANRHGLVTGATGTGKTVSLQKLAEGFSAAGVPVFAADIKGDLSGVAKAGSPSGRMADRAKALRLKDVVPQAFPVRFWDLYADDGIPMGTSVHELGPLFMARLLELNQVQEGALNIIFQRAKDMGDYIRDLEDLKSFVAQAFDYIDEIKAEYGHIAVATLGAIQRQILVLVAQNGWRLFREPALDIEDLLACAPDGRGYINLISADRLTGAPRLYSTFLLFLLSRLFETLPEVGDLEKPKLVFFFDEAHLLFATATPRLMETIERLVRLIRSKGVGVYFVTQSPRDVPESILAQLGHRIQHALRAFTPRDQKLIKAVAQTFRPNPALDIAQVVTSLAVGECLVSTLTPLGVPTMVERAQVLPPRAQVGPIDDEERKAVLTTDLDLFWKYAEDLPERDAYLHFLRRVAPEEAERFAAAIAKAEAADSPEVQAAQAAAAQEAAFQAELDEINQLGFFARIGRMREFMQRRSAWHNLQSASGTTV